MSEATAATHDAHDAETLASALAAAQEELDRRATRIEGLRDEVDDLRQRLSDQARQHHRDLKDRDRQEAALQRRITDLETSVSYRFGHGLVLLVQDPTRIARLPGALVRLARAVLRRWRGR